ncbi:hypothetical protein GCM10025877_15720 [Agromyces mangrovi Wang et al. 2018]|nr:hypothetical protein GCM10025877_15720 [Agromyces mangrovi]
MHRRSREWPKGSTHAVVIASVNALRGDADRRASQATRTLSIAEHLTKSQKLRTLAKVAPRARACALLGAVVARDRRHGATAARSCGGAARSARSRGGSHGQLERQDRARRRCST